MGANIQEVLFIGGIVGLAVLVLIAIDRAGLRARRRAERRAKLARQDELAVPASPSRIRIRLFTILWLAVGAVLIVMGRIRLPGPGQILTWVGTVFGATIAIVGLVIAVKLFRHYDRGVNRAYERANTGDVEGAVAELRAQVEAKGLSAARANALGCLLIKRKDWQGANDMFDEAERFGMDRTVVRNNQGKALMESANYDAAFPLLEEVARANPNELTYQCNLCLVLAELGRVEEAQKQLSRIEDFRKNLIFILGPRYRQSIDGAIQDCRDRLNGMPKADLAALDEL
ncbi:MAG: tetratricopeptide repeat protein [Isosphaerales bacterium]